jgi:hypothetical protein
MLNPAKSRKPKYLRRDDRGKVNDDRIYTPDEIEFMKAMDQYKRENRRPFPTWSDVLKVVKSLGYHK